MILQKFFKNQVYPIIDFASNDWRFLLYGFLMSLWSSPGQTFFISLFSLRIRDDLLLTHGEFGGYYAIATTFSAIALLWIGKLADSITVHRLSLFTLAALSLSSLFFSLINSILMLMLGLFFLRLSGQGMMYHVYSTAITRRYNKTRGRALAICGFGMNVAEATFPVFVTFLLFYMDWRVIWIFIASIALLTFLPFIKTLTTKKINPKSKECLIANSEETIREFSVRRKDAVKDLAFWFVIVWLMVIPGFTITGIFFHQIHLSELKQLTMIEWSKNYLWYAIASIFGAFLSGILVDRFTAHKIAFITQLPMFSACILLWFGNANITLILFFISFGLGGGMLQPMINALLAERYGVKWLGEIKSLLWAMSVFSSALSPLIMGIMIDYGSKLGELMMLLASLSFFSFIAPVICFNMFKFVSFKNKHVSC